ncbi:MAG: hypothetical protein IJ151_03560 [Bacteroidales bacterium]|nr:hypothetical protein [Bacteroidales bacterium]
MEFDTKVKQVFRLNADVSSKKDLDGVCGELWDVFKSSSKEVGEAGGGQFWLDYSNMFCTRYLICDIVDVSPDDQPEGEKRNYRVKIFSAKKLGYIADVVLALLAVGFMWCLSKVVVPEPDSLYVILMVAAAALAGLICAYISRPFGVRESAVLKDKIQSGIGFDKK